MAAPVLAPRVRRKLLALVACIWLFATPAICGAQAHSRTALAEATSALCGKQLVLIGEADHGDGATVEFKAALARQLIAKCGFNAIYFEAGIYDFLNIERRVRDHQPVTGPMLSAAIGGLWSHDAEIAPLIGYLAPRVNSGAVYIGGMDDQIGSAGTLFEGEPMAAELSSVLPQSRQSACREQMTRRRNYAYSDEHPHDAASIASLDACLADIEQKLTPVADKSDRVAQERLRMATEFRSAISRDFLEMSDFVTRRDRAMYGNLRWLMRHAGEHRKAIVWTANDHAAKNPAIDQVYAKGPNLGTLLHRALGSRAFALGISAAGGSHYWTRKEPSRPIPQASPGSVEARALAGRGEDAVYAPAAKLRTFGTAPGSFSLHRPQTARWDQVFDAVVILRTERPPVRIP
jgi:erythromycin esterase-like protein